MLGPADELRAPRSSRLHHHAPQTAPPAPRRTSYHLLRFSQAILLDDVIDALERDGGHFETANLSILVGDNDPLYKRLADANAL